MTEFPLDGEQNLAEVCVFLCWPILLDRLSSQEPYFDDSAELIKALKSHYKHSSLLVKYVYI